VENVAYEKDSMPELRTFSISLVPTKSLLYMNHRNGTET
jgi:hypothetical protein